MNQTIYFRKDIWEKIKDEPEKSKVINELLDKHYSTTTFTADQAKKAGYSVNTGASLRSDDEHIKGKYCQHGFLWGVDDCA